MLAQISHMIRHNHFMMYRLIAMVMMEQNDINDDEDLKALEQFDIMSRIPGMTEEKWESLTEFQREELINEYDSEREKQKELRRLRDKKKQWLKTFVMRQRKETDRVYRQTSVGVCGYSHRQWNIPSQEGETGFTAHIGLH